METPEKRDDTHVEQHGDGDVNIEQPEPAQPVEDNDGAADGSEE